MHKVNNGIRDLNTVRVFQIGPADEKKYRNFARGLTLAVGLTKMAIRKVRVDSLFLDEGFGTLDEEALESALET